MHMDPVQLRLIQHHIQSAGLDLTKQKLDTSTVPENLGELVGRCATQDFYAALRKHTDLAHAKYTGSNKNMGTEFDWRDIKGECPPSATLGTFTGTLVCLIGQTNIRRAADDTFSDAMALSYAYFRSRQETS